MEIRHGVIIMLTCMQNFIWHARFQKCPYNRCEFDELGACPDDMKDYGFSPKKKIVTLRRRPIFRGLHLYNLASMLDLGSKFYAVPCSRFLGCESVPPHTV